MSTKLLTAIILTAVAILAANPPAVNYYSASDLQAMGQKLGTSSNHAKFKSEDLEKYGSGSHTMLAHREGNGSAELHEKEADLFVVVEGDAILVSGGKMVKPHTEKPGEIRAESIEGGQRQKLGVGDVIHIAPNTPHQLLIEAGKPFTYFVMKVAN
jgi:mannose-6-phosphate isomerase-like protein (cupin superfamily)